MAVPSHQEALMQACCSQTSAPVVSQKRALPLQSLRMSLQGTSGALQLSSPVPHSGPTLRHPNSLSSTSSWSVPASKRSISQHPPLSSIQHDSPTGPTASFLTKEHTFKPHKHCSPSNEKMLEGLHKFLSRKRDRTPEDDVLQKEAKKPCPQGAASGLAQSDAKTSADHLNTTPAWSCLLGKASGQRVSSKLSSNPSPRLALSTYHSSSQSHFDVNFSATNSPQVNSKTNFVPSVRPKEHSSPVKENEKDFKRGVEGKNLTQSHSSPRQTIIGQSGVANKDLVKANGLCNRQSSSSQKVHPQQTNPAVEDKLPGKSDKMTKNQGKGNPASRTDKTPSLTPKTPSDGLRNHTLRSTKRSLRQRPLPADEDDLFTPDVMIHGSGSQCRSVTSSIRAEHSPATVHKGNLPGSVASCSSSLTPTASPSPCGASLKIIRTLCFSAEKAAGSPSLKTPFPKHSLSKKASVSLPFPLDDPKISLMPYVRLDYLQPEKSIPSLKDANLEKIPICLVPQSSDKTARTDKNDEPTSSPNIVGSDNNETLNSGTVTTAGSKSASHLSPSTHQGHLEDKAEDSDSMDSDFDLSLNLKHKMDITQSSESSDDELPSLRAILKWRDKPTNTSPVQPNNAHSRQMDQPAKAKPVNYKNSLDLMLLEMKNNQRNKEMETNMLSSCEEVLQSLAEFEETEDTISPEQQQFLLQYPLVSSAIRDVHPGEVVFNLESFGCLFSQDTLQLRHCRLSPKNIAQKTLLWSSPTLFCSNLVSGLFEEAYTLPCPPQVSRFLFRMMSVHGERMVSTRILRVLRTIATTAAYQILIMKSPAFEVWVPSLGDVTKVLMNMGVPFVMLYPLQSLQPPFTEEDILDDIQTHGSSPPSVKGINVFPEHNMECVIQYLALCMELCPRSYSDQELLLLLSLACQLGLETQLVLRSHEHLLGLQRHIVSNIRQWDSLFPRICRSLTNLTADHHNMCWLVSLLPDHKRGRQLRSHLSLSMISKLFNGTCTYSPASTEFQLSDLAPYLHRMRPSSLLNRQKSCGKLSAEEDSKLDQQAYYLCYSLLTLVNEATTFHLFPSEQKEQLLSLCMVLEQHVKRHIIESENCLYRCKVKDLVARIDTKWRMLTLRSRPLQDQLYDWMNLPENMDSAESSGNEEDDDLLMERDEETLEEEVEGQDKENEST